MIQEFKKIWKPYTIGMLWLFGLLWPLLGVHADGTLTVHETVRVWGYILAGSAACLILYMVKKGGYLDFVGDPLSRARSRIQTRAVAIPNWSWQVGLIVVAYFLPLFADRYGTDVAINVLIYICLGLGLNIMVGLCGLLDLGYIAFYGVGAYAYALLNSIYGLGFWVCLPFSAFFACLAGAIVGYPTLRMRGDYLAIVTLGFGEIIRLILNNWMELTNGPNGILGIDAVGMYLPVFENGLTFEHFWMKKLYLFYYLVLGLAIFTAYGIRHLNISRTGRAWESIREDETAAELMGVNTFIYKLLAYVMGAFFAGLAGAFFAARMRFVSPESFTFLESAMVLCMVVLGGMGSIPGIMLGVFALIVLPEVFREFESYRMLIFGSTMVIMMLFRPAGLIPAKRMGTRSDEREG
ncbi:MAG: branched-chain amino acid ABC transporter permease [Desulfotignum sp.]|jgi:branched-chain amino acid transport system permease protein|nr:branched-chain amino acid ABC transporter permease [Desulfotignum sp.]